MPISSHRRFLIISRNFPPLTGGMERLIFNCYQQLSEHDGCDLVGTTGCNDFLAQDDRAFECRLKPLPIFLILAGLQSLRACLRHRYCLIIAGSGLTAPIAILVGKLFRIPTLVFLHGLDLVVDSWFYQYFFVPTLRLADAVIANSHNTARLAQLKQIAPERIHIIFPGVSLPKLTPEDANNFRDQYGFAQRPILLSVGRVIPRKGLAEFLAKAFPIILQTYPHALLVVIGDRAEDALNSNNNAMQQVNAVIERHQLQQSIRFLGRVDDQTLSAAYQSADIHLFPVREVAGDVEGFGMVAVEAAAHGLLTWPVAISPLGIMPRWPWVLSSACIQLAWLRRNHPPWPCVSIEVPWIRRRLHEYRARAAIGCMRHGCQWPVLKRRQAKMHDTLGPFLFFVFLLIESRL